MAKVCVPFNVKGIVKSYIVDYDDYLKYVKNQNKWCIQTNGYMRRNFKGGKGSQLLHRLIMGNPLNVTIDHIDGNKLNNSKDNLRLATYAENNMNRRKNHNNTSGHKNVYYRKDRKSWYVVIQINGKIIYGKHHDLKENAEKEAKELIVKYHGEFAKF